MYKTQIATILKMDSQTRQHFRGVFAIDQLPKRAPTGSYVINYDCHDQPGSHWVAVFSRNDRVEYFDSSGQPPLDSRLQAFVGADFNFNPIKLQRLLENSCGFYCAYFILQRSRNSTSNDILKVLARTNSDYIVKMFLYKHFKPIFV